MLPETIKVKDMLRLPMDVLKGLLEVVHLLDKLFVYGYPTVIEAVSPISCS